MIVLLFTNLRAFSKRPKKMSTIKWKGKAMDLFSSSILAVASLWEVVPLQTRTNG